MKKAFYIFILHFCFNIVNCSLNLDEIKSVRYEIDILDTPTLKDEVSPTLSLRSKYGQQYQCKLPDVSSFLSEAAQRENAVESPVTPTITSLLAALYKRPCLHKYQDWWTYELCYGHDVKQYHKQEGQVVGPVITLGKYESEFNWDNTSLKYPSLPKYHSQTYVNGSRCDLINVFRSTEVRYFCEEDTTDYIARVDEPSTCNYVVHVHTQRLCSHPYFKPRPQSHTISCSPLVTSEQFERYLQKMKEEVPLAEHLKLLLEDETTKSQSKTPAEGEEDQKNIQAGEKAKEEVEEAVSPSSSDAESDDEEEDRPVKKLNAQTLYELMPRVTEILHKEEYSKLVELAPELSPNEDLNIKPLLENYVMVFESIDSTHESIDRRMSLIKNLKSRVQANLAQLMDLGTEDSTIQRTDTNHKLIDTFLNYIKIMKNLELQHTKWRATLQQYREKFRDHLVKLINLLTQVVVQIPPDNSLDLTPISKSFLELFKRYLQSNLEMSRLEQHTWKTWSDDNVEEVTEKARILNEAELSQSEISQENKLKLEKAIKDKLKEHGNLNNKGEPKIQVSVIAADYVGSQSTPISDEDAQYFQKFIVNMLIGHYEAAQESERQERLERNYRLTWDSDDNTKDSTTTTPPDDQNS